MQLPSEKFTIAWFKLAEFVTRKEKERALGIYRLLIHSLPDQAFAAQVEGDLFLAFQDEKAIESYLKAAKMYQEFGNVLQASILYEKLIRLFLKTQPIQKIIFKKVITEYIDCLVTQNNHQKVTKLLSAVQDDAEIFEYTQEVVKNQWEGR